MSIEPFYTAEQVNVIYKKITAIEFTPNVVGELVIRYEEHEATGTMVVE